MRKPIVHRRVSRVFGAGFSLLEVLITMVVVALGLLGVAGMQVSSIKLADAADVRSRGVVFVNDIAERILSNPNNADAYVVGLNGAVTSGSASADVTAWKAALALRLPLGKGSISVADDTASCVNDLAVPKCKLVTIVVQWDESRAKRSAVGANPGLVTFTSTIRV